MKTYSIELSESPFLKKRKGRIRILANGELYGEVGEHKFWRRGVRTLIVSRNFVQLPISSAGMLNFMMDRCLKVCDLDEREFLYMSDSIGDSCRLNLRTFPTMSFSEAKEELVVYSETGSVVARIKRTDDAALQNLDIVAEVEIEDSLDESLSNAVLAAVVAWQFGSE